MEEGTAHRRKRRQEFRPTSTSSVLLVHSGAKQIQNNTSNNNLMLRLLQVPAGPQGQAEAVAYLGFLFPLTQLLRQAQTSRRKRKRLKPRSNAPPPRGFEPRLSPLFTLTTTTVACIQGKLKLSPRRSHCFAAAAAAAAFHRARTLSAVGSRTSLSSQVAFHPSRCLAADSCSAPCN